MPVTSHVSTKRAVRYDLTAEQGVDLDFPITLLNADGTNRVLTGYTALLHVREHLDSDVVLHVMSTENAKITASGSNVTLHFVNTDFSDSDWTNGVYDLEITSPLGKKERIIEGSFVIDREVTR